MIAKIIEFLLLLFLISFFQIRNHIRKEGVKDAILYSLFMVTAGIIGSLLIAGVKLQSHNVLLTKLLMPLGKAILGQ